MDDEARKLIEEKEKEIADLREASRQETENKVCMRTTWQI